MKLSKAIEEFKLDIDVEATRKVYLYTLKKLLKFLGDVELESIDISALRRWREQVGVGLSPHTFRRDIRHCRHFFNWCVNEQFLTCSPAARLKLPTLPQGEPPKAISDLDLERMIDHARYDVLGETPTAALQAARDYAIVRYLAESGGRVGGLVKLKTSDIDLEKGEALVREKAKKSRLVHFGPQTITALRAWLIVRPRNKWGDHLFTGKRGPLTVSGVYRVLQRLAEKSGVEGRFNPHSFRHAFARRLLKNRADLGTVSRLMGHSDIQTTHHYYAVWTNEELAERYREFGGILE